MFQDKTIGELIHFPSFKSVLKTLAGLAIVTFATLTFMILLSVYNNLNSNEITYEIKPVTIQGQTTNIMCVAAYKSLGLDLSCFPIGPLDVESESQDGG